jgi:hypothetical protein
LLEPATGGVDAPDETAGGSYASKRAEFYSRLQQLYGAPGSAAARILADVGWPTIPNLADRPWRGTSPDRFTRQVTRYARRSCMRSFI